MPTFNLKDRVFSTSDYLKILLYGPSGTGKTHLVRSFPTPIYYFDFDHKFNPLLGVDVTVDSYDTSKATASTEFDRFKRTLGEVRKDPRYKTMVVDSISSLDPLVLNWLCAKSGRNLDYPDIQIYGHHKDNWTWLTMDFNSPSTNKNVVIVGHDHYKIMKDGGAHKICPLVAGDKIQDEFPSKFAETYYYTNLGPSNAPQRRLYYRSHNKAIASSAVLNGCGYIDEPTYEKLCAEMKKATEERQKQTNQTGVK